MNLTILELRGSQSGSDRVIWAKFGQRSAKNGSADVDLSKIFQDVAIALLHYLTLPLTNPHLLTHSLQFAVLAKLCPDDTVIKQLF